VFSLSTEHVSNDDPRNYADNDERQAQDDSISLVREYIARVIRGETGAATKRQFAKTGIALIGRAEQLQVVVSKLVFRQVICRGKSPKLVLKHLRFACLLNLGRHQQIWVRRRFPKPLGHTRVVSIKPEIQRYQTRCEQLILRQMEREQQGRHRRIEQQRRKGAPDNIVPLFR
jgi:hypothetical protein